MGYMHIDNLYKSMEILQTQKMVYCLEKIDGTSSNIKFSDGQIHFFHGGGCREEFLKLFDEETLKIHYRHLSIDKIIFFGEHYGGKIQKMRHAYGDAHSFTVFDVFIGSAKSVDGKEREGRFLDVPDAKRITEQFGLEFVPYELVECNVENLNACRDKFSAIAALRGMGNEHIMEGVVIRPFNETPDRFGNRLIVKHKRAEFSETSTPREISPEKIKAIEDARAIAEEWVTENRLDHVLDHLSAEGKDITDIKNMKMIINAMMEDVYREAKGEIVESKATENQISKLTALMFKKRLQSVLQ